MCNKYVNFLHENQMEGFKMKEETLQKLIEKIEANVANFTQIRPELDPFVLLTVGEDGSQLLIDNRRLRNEALLKTGIFAGVERVTRIYAGKTGKKGKKFSLFIIAEDAAGKNVCLSMLDGTKPFSAIYLVLADVVDEDLLTFIAVDNEEAKPAFSELIAHPKEAAQFLKMVLGVFLRLLKLEEAAPNLVIGASLVGLLNSVESDVQENI